MNFNYHQSFVTIDHTYDTPVVTTQRYLWMRADEIYSAYGRRVGYRLSANEVALDGSFVWNAIASAILTAWNITVR